MTLDTRCRQRGSASRPQKKSIRIALTSIRRQETAGRRRVTSHTKRKLLEERSQTLRCGASSRASFCRWAPRRGSTRSGPGGSAGGRKKKNLPGNRVCVLAQKSAPEDEKVWAGVVHFEHSSANLTARIGRLLGDPAALARCRRQTYHVFRHRFDVAAIFRRAKVPDLLRSLGWRLPRSGKASLIAGRAQRVDK